MASTYLSKTFSSAGDRKTWTWSSWIKFSDISSGNRYMASGYVGSSDTGYFAWYFHTDSKLTIQGWTTNFLVTNQVFRDPSAWLHLVITLDTTQATASDRLKVYVNGSEITSFSTDNRSSISQNSDLGYNGAGSHIIGGYQSSGSANAGWDGSMTHIHFIDGTAYDADTFGETDSTTGIWKPKTAPSVTYGTNGFFLKFENSGAFGTDSSGNGNNFTVNGTMTQTIDTPSNVFATFNPLVKGSGGTGATFSNGNTNVISGSAAWFTAPATLGVTSGKYYWEIKCGTISGTNYIQAGISSESAVYTNANSYHASTTYSYAYHWDGSKYVNNSATASWGTAPSTGDIIMIALDCDNGFIYAGLNGTWQNSGDPTSGGSGTGALTTLASNQVWFPTVSAYASTHNANFGNGYFGTTAVASAQNPDDGIGIFEFTPPTGYKALCTKSINAQEYD